MKKIELKDPQEQYEVIIAESKSRLQDLLVLGAADTEDGMTRQKAVDEVLNEFQDDKKFDGIINNAEIKRLLVESANEVVETLNRESLAQGTKAVRAIARGKDAESVVSNYREKMSQPHKENAANLEELSKNIDKATDAEKVDFLKAQVAEKLYTANAKVTAALADDLSDVSETKSTADALHHSRKIFRGSDKQTIKVIDRELGHALRSDNPNENYIDRAKIQRSVVRQNFRRKIQNSLDRLDENLQSGTDLLYSTLQAQTMVSAFEKNDQLVEQRVNENLKDLQSQQEWQKDISHKKPKEIVHESPKKNARDSLSRPRKFSFRRDSSSRTSSRRQSIDLTGNEEWKEDKFVNPRNPKMTMGLKNAINKAKEAKAEEEKGFEKGSGGPGLGNSSEEK